MKKSLLISTLLIVAALVLSGCNGSDNNEEVVDKVSVDTPSSYTTRSAANYSENSYGLISAVNAAKMITDWENNKPEGKRKLFVMQVGNIYGFEGTHEEPNPKDGTMIELPNGYINGDATKGVFVFDRTAGCTSATVEESRTDGVSAIPKPVFTIEQMDQAFEAYGIDPNQDVIMLALAEANGGYMAGMARMWYTLTYWGYPQESIMMLNGQASNVLNPNINTDIADLGITQDDIFSDVPSEYPMQKGITLVKGEDWESISTIKRDGTILQATMEDMMNLVDEASETNLILDARSAAEYDGTKRAKTEYKTCGDTQDQQCYTAYDGHIKGAMNLLYTDVVNIDDATVDVNGDGNVTADDATYTFKDLDSIETAFANAGYSSGDTVYTYCRTGTKASLLTFTSAKILGYPTRMYDGSWIQWGKMANAIDTDGNELVPAGNKWLTDAYSESVTYQDDLVSPLNQDLLDLDAEHTNAMITMDKAAK